MNRTPDPTPLPLDVSAVIPCHNEAESLEVLYERLQPQLAGVGDGAYEILIVDDGSTDATLAVARRLAERDPRVTVIALRGNFGKAAALSAGFERARGRFVLTLDADLQDDPVEIPRFLAKLEEGLDLVSGWKRKRHDPWHKVLPSRVFNSVVNWATGIRLHDVNCGFKAYRREILDEIHIYGEMHRFIPVLAHWRRFRVGEIEVNHHPRRFGVSKYGVSRFFRGLMDLFTVAFLMRYRKKPSHFFGKLGIVTGTAGFLICCYMTYLRLIGERIGDRPLLALGILLLVVGTQFFATGLIAELITVTSDVRAREYSIREVIQFAGGVTAKRSASEQSVAAPTGFVPATPAPRVSVSEHAEPHA